MTDQRKPPAWRRYLRFWGTNIEQDVDDELQFHVDMRTREYIARGLAPDAARIAALHRLGRLADARNQCLVIGQERERTMRNADMLESVAGDIRFAVRSFARTPGWTIVAFLTIALGIGASTAVFSVVDSLLVHPMSYPNANRIAVVRHDVPVSATAHLFGPIEPDHLTAWRSARSLEALEGYDRRDTRLTIGGESHVAHAVSIDSTFLSFAGARLLIGRNFARDEMTPNGPGAVLLAESYWRRQFGAARDIVGKSLRADGRTLTIIGVAPAALRLPDFDGDPAEIWLPRIAGGEQRLRGVLARLRPRTSIGDAEAELDSISARAGLTADDLPGSRFRLLRPGETLRFRTTLLMLAGAVALLLLVACANVAHLLLARSATRERELAVRHALGAGRMRVARQLLTESFVLTCVGGVGAVLIGGGSLRVASSVRPAKLSALSQISFDRNLVILAATLTIATALAVGLLVALRAARNEIGEALRAGSGTGGTGRQQRRLGSSLVVTEIALSATLLVGALLLVRGVMDLQNTKLGFDSRGLYGVTFSFRGSAVASAAQHDFAQKVLERGRRIPGLRGVTIASTVPPNGAFLMDRFETPERSASAERGSTISINSVAPNYFAILGISLVGGRTFDAGSIERNEVVINEAMAKQLWPSSNGPYVGNRFRSAGNGRDVDPGRWFVVVAVSRDAVMHGLLGDTVEPTIYFPFGSDRETGRVTLIVRGAGDAAFMAALRRFATTMQPTAAIPAITSVERELSDSIAEPRFSMRILAAFAALAVVLAAIGLYGVIAYTVARRTREIGIRITLGATRGAIARLVIGDGLRLSLIGIMLGVLGAAAATKLLQRSLSGIHDADIWSFTLGGVMLLGVSATACLIPTLRATAVDPAVAVRTE